MKILRSILPVVALALLSTRVAFAACTPISMAPSDVTAGTVQTPYTLTFTASGSAATPLGYEVTSGVLPGGQAGRLIEVDLMAPATTVHHVLKLPRCPVCGQLPPMPEAQPAEDAG